MHISDRAKKPSHANIQVIGIHLVKINNPMSRIQPRQRASVNLQEENPPRRPTPSKTVLESARSNDVDSPSGVSNGD